MPPPTKPWPSDRRTMPPHRLPMLGLRPPREAASPQTTHCPLLDTTRSRRRTSTRNCAMPTPEERANYMQMLEGKDSETVRQVLYNRRLTMRADQQRLAAPPVGGGQGAIQATGANASSTGGSPRSLNAGEGLGNVNAWPRQGRAANPSPPTIMTFRGRGDVNAAQYDSPAQQGSGPPPLGHSSGYHGDLDTDAASGAGFAVVRPGSVPPGR